MEIVMVITSCYLSNNVILISSWNFFVVLFFFGAVLRLDLIMWDVNENFWDPDELPYSPFIMHMLAYAGIFSVGPGCSWVLAYSGLFMSHIKVAFKSCCSLLKIIIQKWLPPQDYKLEVFIIKILWILLFFF